MNKIQLPLLLCLLVTSCLQSTEKSTSSFIEVIGESKGSVPPGYARIEIYLYSRSDSLADATRETKSKSQRIADIAMYYGIDEEDVKIGKARGWRNREKHTRPEHRYVSCQRLILKYRTLGDYPGFMHTLIEANETFCYHLSLIPENQETFVESLKQEAIRQTQQVARKRANMLGAKIGEVHRISEPIIEYEDPDIMEQFQGLKSSKDPHEYYVPGRLNFTPTVQVAFLLSR